MVGEERAYLGWMITCVFQTRYGFCFFQLRGGYEKAEPVPGSFHASILSPRRLTSLANVGLSRAQLVPSCKYGKRQHILQKQDFQEDNSYRIVLSYRYCYLTTWSLWWNNRVEITTRQGIERMLICVILRRKVTQVAWWFESKSRVIYVKWLCKQIWITRIGDKSLLLNSFNCLSELRCLMLLFASKSAVI